MKYLVSLISTFALLVGINSTAYSQFTDVSNQSTFGDAVLELQRSGIVEGYSDGSFGVDSTINRAELLKIALETRYDSEEITGSNCFNDVTDEWFAKYVCFGKKQRIIDGYDDGTFKPEQNINFAELSKILANVFDVTPETYSSEWFRGYVTALGSVNAIPTSVSRFDKQITRGEMAEMMYRLKEGINSKESTNYFAIKHPDVSFNTNSSDVQYVANCTDLEAIVSEFSNQNTNRMYMMEDMAVPTASPMALSQESGVANKVSNDYSATNVQVAGIDEGDIVKTDGEYIYSLHNNTLSVVKVGNNGSMQLILEHQFTTKETKEDQFYANELYLEDGYIVVTGYANEQLGSEPPVPVDSNVSNSRIGLIAPVPDYYWPRYQQFAQVRLYKMSSNALDLKRTVSIKGSQIATRLKNGRLYLVTNDGPMWGIQPLAGTDNPAGLPLVKDSATLAELSPAVPCNRVAILPQYTQSRYITTTVVPINETSSINHDTILASGDTVYMSHNNLYVAGQEWNYGWMRDATSTQTTHVYRFAVNGDGIEYKATGSVPGGIINQFAMDEYEQGFRIATTIDQNWQTNEPSTNNLFVLNFDLDTVGKITDIAPGERIYSVRFMGDRTYMVTFKKVDPFFVIDTSNPRNPSILGKLKLPGYSDYLHPYDEDHVIGFGKEAVEAKEGDFAWYQGMKVALFDVSDVTNPSLKDSITIGDRGTSSELLHNHKALLFEKDRNLLAFPVSIHTLSEEQKNANITGNAWGEQTFQGAIVYTINQNGFTERGRVTHYSTEDLTKMGSYFYGKNIERILRVGSSLFTIGQSGIQAHDETDLTKEGSVQFTETEEYYPIMY